MTKPRLFITVNIILLTILSGVSCTTPLPTDTPGQALTKGISDPESEIISKLSQALGQEVQLVIKKRNEFENWLFLVGYPVNPDGSRIDYTQTPYADDWSEGYFDDVFFGLFQFDPSIAQYRLKELEFGATDAPFIDWQEKYRLQPLT